jgi:hypothetical protein
MWQSVFRRLRYSSRELNNLFVMQCSNDMMGYVNKQGLNVLCGVAASSVEILFKRQHLATNQWQASLF